MRANRRSALLVDGDPPRLLVCDHLGPERRPLDGVALKGHQVFAGELLHGALVCVNGCADVHVRILAGQEARVPC